MSYNNIKKINIISIYFLLNTIQVIMEDKNYIDLFILTRKSTFNDLNRAIEFLK